MPSLVLIAPGSIETLTGGYGYDRRIVEGLRNRGWIVDVRELDDSFPFPTAAARKDAARLLETIPAGATVLIDGLAMGVLSDEIASEASRLRIVALVHHPLAAETGLEPATAGNLEASERRALGSARLVVVTSQATVAALGRYDVDRARIVVVEPGTDRGPLARGSQGPTLQLLCVATLIPRKGHAILFDALTKIPQRNWRLKCVGSTVRQPPTAQRARQWLEANRLADRIELAGEMNLAGIATEYDRADVFVLATLHEGYGMAVAEALARGLPVIASATGAIPQLVGTEAGVLVQPGDVNALAAALARVLGDADFRERLRQGAGRMRDRLPTWDVAAARMEEALVRIRG
jgi:glycosyltransferase involved in cell wall biosynthesis